MAFRLIHYRSSSPSGISTTRIDAALCNSIDAGLKKGAGTCKPKYFFHYLLVSPAIAIYVPGSGVLVSYERYKFGIMKS